MSLITDTRSTVAKAWLDDIASDAKRSLGVFDLPVSISMTIKMRRGEWSAEIVFGYRDGDEKGRSVYGLSTWGRLTAGLHTGRPLAIEIDASLFSEKRNNFITNQLAENDDIRPMKRAVIEGTATLLGEVDDRHPEGVSLKHASLIASLLQKLPITNDRGSVSVDG